MRVALLGVSVAAQAQIKPEGLTLRAVDGHITDEVIRYIARNAKPLELSLAGAPRATPRELITKMCGTFHPSYYALFAAENKKFRLDPDKPIGRTAAALLMPACLYAKQLKTPSDRPASAIAQASDKLGSTGGIAVDVPFGGSVKFEWFPIKRDARAAVLTAPVYLVPKKLSSQDFLAAVPLMMNRDGTPLTTLRSVQPIEGEIVLGEIASKPGEPGSKPGMQCREEAGAPFNADMVAANFQFSKRRAESGSVNMTPGYANVVVVDNGFFGASADLKLQPIERFAGSPFKPKYFVLHNESTVERRLTLTSSDVASRYSWPINFSNQVQPNYESGHGTHVAGLVLGGPYFSAYRDALAPDSFGWARITIINIARGARQLLPGSPDLLQSGINLEARRRIVNMSIAHDGRGSKDTIDAYDRLFREGPQNLFIVSAGNHSQDVSTEAVVPAMHGGLTSDHVITVAALDGDGRLAKFSNIGSLAVDMAAPGCGIASWISNTNETVRLSGTSQAAPLVTFAASLLRSLAEDSEARMLKSRLIASGDMLEATDQASTAYRVALNIPKALFWFDDYVKLTGVSKGEYLGKVRSLKGVRCVGDPSAGGSRPQSDLWSFKREPNSQRGWIFLGKAVNRIRAPCQLDDNDPGNLTFIPTHTIGPNGPQELKGTEISVPLSSVAELVLANYGS